MSCPRRPSAKNLQRLRAETQKSRDPPVPAESCQEHVPGRGLGGGPCPSRASAEPAALASWGTVGLRLPAEPSRETGTESLQAGGGHKTPNPVFSGCPGEVPSPGSPLGTLETPLVIRGFRASDSVCTLPPDRCPVTPNPGPAGCTAGAGGLEETVDTKYGQGEDRYVAFLELFLQTAEKHFMVGHRVTCYVFTDRPGDVPRVPLGEGRQVAVLEVRSYSRRQDVSVHRVEMIRNFSRRCFLHEVDSPVCADVDVRFRDHVGVEILSPLFGTLHPGFYGAAREAFTYERRPQSQAHVPRDEGDFYYAGGFFGGSVAEVLRLTSACHQATVVDRAHGIEAVWHDESHLNRYLLDHKPTKVLSPEYLWDEQLLGWPAVVKKLRYVTVPKSHRGIRD
ncbi:histo-blood group ABO system transferase 2-like [Lynx canadensis]|uniref:histo-blood group ABO system transferase 2-like n=1 Tax=Lynx canadensis TaxID=61383 RepID=UPI0011B0A91E|nr:histo-blood group ABO system transferase 2-like [Lynx canadensis]